MKRHILVVENNAPCRDMLRQGLQAAGFDVSVLYDSVKVPGRVNVERPSLIIVADDGRREGGVAALQALRSSDDDLPVIVLTERDDATERIVALECGADDVISKPINIMELLVRVRNILKRAAYRPLQDPVYHAPYYFDGFKVDFLARSLFYGDQKIRLTESEFALLNLLVSAPGKVFPRDFIVERIAAGARANVAIWVHRVRARIRNASGSCEQIQTVHGKGYAFCPSSTDSKVRVSKTQSIRHESDSDFKHVAQAY